MRQLSFSINTTHFQQIKQDIVPALFTEHQFQLAIKRFSNKALSPTERNEFSRTVSRRMKAVNAISNKNEFVYGQEKIIRLNEAKNHLRTLSKKFRNKHIIISGSFLHSDDYKDIDVFIISRNQRKDQRIGQYHINYLTDINTALFKSLSKLCVSNKEITPTEANDYSPEKLVSLYQEIANDYANGNIDIQSIREFAIHAALVGGSPIPDSNDLKNLIDSIYKISEPMTIIRNMLSTALIMSRSTKQARAMVESYQSLQKEYPQHKKHYEETVKPFKDTLDSV